MTKQTLYSLRTHVNLLGTTGRYYITKFVDGEVESGYECTEYECECPAGSRPSCRHRQMLPEMLARQVVNTHWFWDFDARKVVDFDGNLKSNFDAMNELADKAIGATVEDFEHEHGIMQPHSEAAITPAFDAGSTGSNPVVATKPSWRRM